MFEIGWTEIVVIAIIACIVLEVKDIPKILKYLRKSFNYLNNLVQDLRQAFHDIEEETTKITDLEGNEHEAYNVNELEDLSNNWAADIKNDNKRRKKN